MVSKNMSKDYPKKNVSKKLPADIIGHLMDSKNVHTPTIPKDDINLMHTHTKR